jgi:hypothetical protein
MATFDCLSGLCQIFLETGLYIFYLRFLYYINLKISKQIHQFLPIVDRITVIERGSDRLPTGRASHTVIIMGYEMMVIKEADLMSANINVLIFVSFLIN